MNDIIIGFYSQYDIGQMPPHDIVPAMAEGALRGRVELGDASLMVNGRNAVQRRVQDRALARLAAPQLLLRPPAVLNIRRDSAPFHDGPGRVEQRSGAKDKSAILAFAGPQAGFQCAGAAGGQQGLPALQQLRQVLGMDRTPPALAATLLEAQTGVFAPAPVEEVEHVRRAAQSRPTPGAYRRCG